ncbi:hypothetical protein RUM43_005382 [Polyplax serrata]|uniref:Fringe-like glycosyltransferase domain-containing protein n=1 Tax=Polyplax serrata TaxID=468196 RepID=A0AAN8RUM6_POLSC
MPASVPLLRVLISKQNRVSGSLGIYQTGEAVFVSMNAASHAGRRPILRKISFWFATGGAGFCLSRSLALKMMPVASFLSRSSTLDFSFFCGSTLFRNPSLLFVDRPFSKKNPTIALPQCTQKIGFGTALGLESCTKCPPIFDRLPSNLDGFISKNVRGGKFISVGEKIRLPDDVTMGYIIEHLLRKNLTVVEQFHSHLEPMKFLRRDTLRDQISLSYSRYGKDDLNVVKIEGFSYKLDPTRFLSLHCYLFPNFKFCPR